jgi:hypothetical protein
MKILLSLIATALYFSSCIGTTTVTQTSGLSHAELASIPKGSKEIIILEHEDDLTLYDKIIDALLQRGHRIIKDDKEKLYILTEGKDVGQSTLQRMTIVIKFHEASIKTEWMPGQDASMGATAFSGINFTPSWSIAEFTTGRPAIAFAEAVAISKAVGGKILYK